MRRLYITALFVAVAFGQQTAKMPTCGGPHATIHDCKCAARVARIRQAAISQCIDKGDSKAYDACVRKALAGKSHCEIAERYVEGADGGAATGSEDSPYIRPEGDHVKTPMGEYCAMACKKHRCECAEEQACSF